MILAFSTSSRLASLALFTQDGETVWFGDKDAPQSASSACIALLGECLGETGRGLKDITLFAADTGPGSFTGVRVGIVLAKTFGYLHGVLCAGANAFDLVDANSTVILPSRRGEVFIRRPGYPPDRATEAPDTAVRGYGLPIAEPEFPHARNFAPLIPTLRPMPAENLVPAYLIEPSISIPKKPFPGLRP